MLSRSEMHSRVLRAAKMSATTPRTPPNAPDFSGVP
jgi:hypothetical protein